MPAVVTGARIAKISTHLLRNTAAQMARAYSPPVAQANSFVGLPARIRPRAATIAGPAITNAVLGLRVVLVNVFALLTARRTAVRMFLRIV